MSRNMLVLLLILASPARSALAEQVATLRIDTGPALPFFNAADGLGPGLRAGVECDIPISGQLSAGIDLGYLELFERRQDTTFGSVTNSLDLIQYGLHLAISDPVPVGLTTELTLGGGAYRVHTRVHGVLRSTRFLAESRLTEPGFHVGAGVRWNENEAWGFAVRATAHTILTFPEETFLATLSLGAFWRGR